MVNIIIIRYINIVDIIIIKKKFCMIIYFTGTGNSRYVAEALADRLDDETVSANELIKAGQKGTFTSSKPYVFVFPVYVSNIAKPFADFLRNSDFSGNNKAYFIATAAAAAGTSANEGMNICKVKGLQYCGTELVRMPQNYIIYFKMTEPEECDRRIAEALKKTEDFAHIIKSENNFSLKKESAFSHGLTRWVEKLYYGFFTTTKQFYAKDDCINCGICEKRCPINNIIMKDGKPVWKDKCYHCVSCINSCPKKSIEFGKHTSDKPRYLCREYQKQ